MAPAYWGLHVFTFFKNFSIPMGVKGTPKSGQLVKWNCVTRRWGFLFVTSPTCRGKGGSDSSQILRLTFFSQKQGQGGSYGPQAELAGLGSTGPSLQGRIRL